MTPPFVGDIEVCVKAFAQDGGTVLDLIVIRRMPDRTWKLSQTSFERPEMPVADALQDAWPELSAKIADVVNRPDTAQAA